MKHTILIYITLLVFLFAGKSCDDLNLGTPGVVFISQLDTINVSKDTLYLPRDTSALGFLAEWYVDTLKLPSDTVWKDTLIVYRDTLYQDTLFADTLYADTLYADTLKVPIFMYPYDELISDIRDEIITPFPDTTGFYSMEFSGISKADEIRVVPNCYDATQNEKFSIRLAIQDSLADSLLPSNRKLEAGEHLFRHITPDTLNCRGVMTYWITAKKDSSEIVGVKFTDIGHRLFVGNNNN